MLLVMCPLLRYQVRMIECYYTDCPVLKNIRIHEGGICISSFQRGQVIMKDLPALVSLKGPYWGIENCLFSVTSEEFVSYSY